MERKWRGREEREFLEGRREGEGLEGGERGKRWRREWERKEREFGEVEGEQWYEGDRRERERQRGVEG